MRPFVLCLTRSNKVTHTRKKNLSPSFSQIKKTPSGARVKRKFDAHWGCGEYVKDEKFPDPFHFLLLGVEKMKKFAQTRKWKKSDWAVCACECVCVCGVNLQKRKVVDLIRRLSPTALCLSLSRSDWMMIKKKVKCQLDTSFLFAASFFLQHEIKIQQR